MTPKGINLNGAYYAVVFLATSFLMVSSARNRNPDAFFSSSIIDLKRIPKTSTSDISVSGSIARERRIRPDYRDDDLDNFGTYFKRAPLQQESEASGNVIFDDRKNTSPKKSTQAPTKAGNYGYPYRMAPTLPPFIKHISDRYDDVKSSAISSSEPKIPPMPSMPSMPKMTEKDELTKRSDSVKKGFFDDSSEFSRIFDSSSYKEPKYRNSYDLDYSPRRMYEESGGPYSRPFRFSSTKSRPAVSPRDPYLDSSVEPTDGFYPKVKNNGVTTSYSSYGKKDKYYKTVPDSAETPSRGYGNDEDDDGFIYPTSEEMDFELGEGGYVRNHKSSGSPDSFKDSSYSEPPSSGPVSSERDGYDSLYNSPITGMTRKRLLDYAGASDLYRGEPDYIKSVSFRKTKHGPIEDDYHPYPRSRTYSFTDYSFDDSRKIPIRAKRQVFELENVVPKCAQNTTIPMCLTDQDYPTEQVTKLLTKNAKFLSQLTNSRLQLSDKKTENRTPESVEDLEKTQGICFSRKGVVYPKQAIDTEGIWRIVINAQGAQQGVEVEVCRSTESPCDFVPTAIPTKCVQKFSYVSLITVNSKDNSLEHHDFPIPSTCSCSVGRPIRIPLL